jgi:hypothetical protein
MMIDLSFAGLLGAILGTAVAAVVYAPLVALAERGFKARGQPQTAQEREMLGQEISLLRRTVLAADIIVLAGIGYWIGMTLGG